MFYRYTGELMGLLGAYRSIRNWWQRFGLEDACEASLDEWEQSRPDYMAKIQGWVKSGNIPDDEYLTTLCKVYQRRLQA